MIRIKDAWLQPAYPGIMASVIQSLDPETHHLRSSPRQAPDPISLQRFRAAIPGGARHARIADRLCAIGEVRSLALGENLAAHGEEDRFVFVASGATKLVARIDERRRRPAPSAKSASRADAEPARKTQILAFHFTGDVVAIRDTGDHASQLVALKRSEVIVFPAASFLDRAQEDQAVIRWLVMTSLEALHASRARMRQLGHMSARHRIADFLAWMAQREGAGARGPCELALPMSRGDMADALGLRLETVSRHLAELRESGLIETQGRSIVRVRDLAELISAAAAP